MFTVWTVIHYVKVRIVPWTIMRCYSICAFTPGLTSVTSAFNPILWTMAKRLLHLQRPRFRTDTLYSRNHTTTSTTTSTTITLPIRTDQHPANALPQIVLHILTAAGSSIRKEIIYYYYPWKHAPSIIQYIRANLDHEYNGTLRMFLSPRFWEDVPGILLNLIFISPKRISALLLCITVSSSERTSNLAISWWTCVLLLGWSFLSLSSIPRLNLNELRSYWITASTPLVPRRRSSREDFVMYGDFKRCSVCREYDRDDWWEQSREIVVITAKNVPKQGCFEPL